MFNLTLTLLHSEQPKLCGVLAVLSAIGLNKFYMKQLVSFYLLLKVEVKNLFS